MRIDNRWTCTLGMVLLMCTEAAAAPTEPLPYPPARRSDQHDTYHGVSVADPYRWMEDIDAPETRAWVSAEGKLSREYLDAIPARARIQQMLTKIWNYERWTPPVRHGRKWFYSHNSGLQNQSVIFVTDDPTRSGRILLDPNLQSADGTVSLRESAVSRDGHLFAYALSDAGSDWQIWHVRNVDTGIDLPDTLKWSKAGSCTWVKDGSGFYYTAYDPPSSESALKATNEFQTLRFHRLGTSQKADSVVYRRTDSSQWFYSATVSDDGRYLIITANLGTEPHNEILIRDLRQRLSPVTALLPTPDATYDVIGNVGDALMVRTDQGAPHYRIVKIDPANSMPSRWTTVIPENTDTIDSASIVGGQLIVNRLHDAHSIVERFSLDGAALGALKLPEIGTAEGFLGHTDDKIVFYSFSSFNTPPSIFRLDLEHGISNRVHAPQISDFVPDMYETHQVFTSSKDGTRVPIFIVAAKGTKLDGSNPTLLYGYGGFNVSLTPQYTPSIAGWLQLGGVYAVATLRGGGEYGSEWHDAGKKLQKQHVFDDFIAAAEYLSAARWTSPRHLALRGGSNGGLLIGAVEEQRPELAAAVIAQVGVMDMVRFREFTVGKAWESDYGSVDDLAEFGALYAYSPYHNVRAGVTYPQTLVTTGDHDDRVFPAHSFKFAAAMQHASPNGKPILLRVETRAGHGQGKPTSKQIDEITDVYAFALDAVGIAH